MKRIFTVSLFVLSATISILAQDIIVTIDAKKIEAKIFEVSKTEIKYKEQDNLEGPIFILETKEINSIIYSNGKVVLYNQTPETKKEETIEQLSLSEDTSDNTETLIPGQDYNVEILLLSGQIIKGKLIETANNYVAYTLKAEYYTLPASQIEKVTDIRNGTVTKYNGKNLDGGQSSAPSSSPTSSESKGGRIYRDNGEYYYNNTYISSKEVARILEKENTSAYNQWQKADGMLIGGSVCAGIGGGLVIGGLFSLISKNYLNCAIIEGCALVPLSIGLGLTLGASSHYNKAIDIYNSKYDHAAIQLRWGVSANGVGLALAF